MGRRLRAGGTTGRQSLTPGAAVARPSQPCGTQHWLLLGPLPPTPRFPSEDGAACLRDSRGAPPGDLRSLRDVGLGLFARSGVER